ARASRAEFSKAYFLSHTSVETEGRAVWNHSGLGAYPGDWNRAAKELAAAGVNIILPNMAWAGVAHYPSEILPHSKTFTQYGDQIAQCVQAAHAHGLEVHVWKITWNLEGAPKEFVEKIRAEGRTQVSATGEALNWLCPSHPKNVLLELDSILEIVTNYDVDGIHLDYIRYPGSHACYCDGCRERFVRTIRKPINEWPAEVLPKTGAYGEQYTEWRVQQITRLVRLIHKRTNEVDPEIKISAAVFGWYPGCIQTIGQDWVAWAKSGYIDFVCPMNYTEDAGYFTELLTNQLALMPKGVPIYPGIGATASNSLLTPDAVVEQIYLSRNLGASGWTIFDYSVDISETLLPALTLGISKRKARPPHQ
ncbi:family 10 glycosylhydrolase, partial [Candidatus Poribacteria bacterium]|nr:family 10 glycosylhydrolase [Candidatus Poribacteria bacterium]